MAQRDKATSKKNVRIRRPGESLTPDEIEQAKEAFIAAYAKYGNVGAACDKACIHRSTVYRWLEHDETFSFRHEQAKQDYCDRLRQEIDRRAHDGVLKPVFQGGVKVGSIREYSDTLLIFHAKAHMPEYRDKVQVQATMQGSVTHDIASNPAAALYATLFVAALNPGGEDDASGPSICRE